jgi:hypothetical protein
MVSVPWFAAAVPLLAFVFNRIRQYVQPIMRELKRLDASTRSPILSLFAETLNGTASIRAYGTQQECIDKMYALSAVNHKMCRWCECSCDVYLLQSAHATLTINMQLYMQLYTLQSARSQSSVVGWLYASIPCRFALSAPWRFSSSSRDTIWTSASLRCR